MTWLLYSIPERRTLAAEWPQPELPVAPGSLVKPFTALAYAAYHRYFFPDHFCRGLADRCWLARGHGRLGLRDAIAYSCNHYFRQLAAGLPPHAVPDLLARFGLTASPDAPADARIGLGDTWRFPPELFAGAYAELFSRPADPGVFPVLDGMRRAARYGTARALGPGYFAKTGTGPNPRLDGDGFAIIAWPETGASRLVLLREPGVPGSRAVELFRDRLPALRTRSA